MNIIQKIIFRKRFIRNFEDNIYIIANKLAEIEYLRKIENDTNFEECNRINELKDELNEFLMYIRTTIFTDPGLRGGRGQKIVRRCFEKEVWRGFAVEDACTGFADYFEYKDDLRDLMYRVYARMVEIEEKILEYNITVFWNWFKSL